MPTLTQSKSLAVLFLLAALAGCGRDASAPLAPAATGLDADVEIAARPPEDGAFYPLTLGNRWEYEVRTTIALVTDPPPTPEVILAHRVHELTGTETLFGREYVVERQTSQEEGQAPIVSWVRYRQDRDGLYEADVSTSDPPGDGVRAGVAAASARVHGAPARMAWQQAYERLAVRRDLVLRAASRGGARVEGVLPNEIQRLAYRLHPGLSWVIRPDPLFTSTVERRERLELPIGVERAYRIRVESPLFGPADEARFWYSTAGLLRVVAHFEETATDEQGNVIGVLIADDVQEITALDVAERP